MFVEKSIVLKVYEQLVEARIVRLTPDLAEEKLMGEWWGEDCLRDPLPPQIDRYWNWNAIEIEVDGRILTSEKVAIVTGEDDELAVQGAMLISTEPIQSTDGQPCLFVELLFTAPRNRPELRKDDKQFVVGVGTQLLRWGAHLSREGGCGGRLRLDASPDFVTWYEKRGLQSVDLDPIVYEDVEYTPMELNQADAQRLIAAWENS